MESEEERGAERPRHRIANHLILRAAFRQNGGELWQILTTKHPFQHEHLPYGIQNIPQHFDGHLRRQRADRRESKLFVHWTIRAIIHYTRRCELRLQRWRRVKGEGKALEIVQGRGFMIDNALTRNNCNCWLGLGDTMNLGFGLSSDFA